MAYLTHSFFPTCDAYDAAMLYVLLRGGHAARARAAGKGLMATASATGVAHHRDAAARVLGWWEWSARLRRACAEARAAGHPGRPPRDGESDADETDETEEVRAYDENDASVVADSDSDSSESASDENAKVAKVSLTSEEWTLEAAREMAARALREGEGGTRR